MKFVITGYYDKNNYGDDLFKEIATSIFIDKNKNEKIEECSIIPIDRLIEYTKLNSSSPCDRLVSTVSPADGGDRTLIGCLATPSPKNAPIPSAAV